MRLRRSIFGLLLAANALAQSVAPSPTCPSTTGALYSRIRSVALDPQQVYHVRGAEINRPGLSLNFDDGTLAFTEDICGRITGAFFAGEGEVRLRPTSRVERGSLALFTGMAILEEQFTSAYLRFNDDTAETLRPFFSAAPDGADFVKLWSDPSRALADFDALRLLLDLSHFLPAPGSSTLDWKFPSLLHVHLLGKKLGAFEVFWDAASAEPLWAGQPRLQDGAVFFDIWTSFLPANVPDPAISSRTNDISIKSFRIRASVEPPTRLRALTEADLVVRKGGERAVLFELSRDLKIDSVESNGRPVDFIQNPAIEGSQLQRKGNDLIAVVFPASLAAGQALKLSFHYAGEVLSDAGNGLLYVGERGNWYPNLGLSPAQFEMEFHYPSAWTLLATGKRIAEHDDTSASPATVPETVSQWKSDVPIPVAGFNLGKYTRAEAKSGSILVEAFGTRGVEKSFPKPKPEVVAPPDFPTIPTSPRTIQPILVTPPPPSPARDAQAVADRAAQAITEFSQWFGPFPYNSLALTQMPGNLSQGWPGLVFLSSFAFLNPQEQSDLHLDPVTRSLDSEVLVHETAHQWWGDLVHWNSYHDQWIAEGLANYASLLILEQHNPAQFRQVLERYRRDLLTKNKDDEWLRDAGPVTLGARLESSHFPFGYDSISYERGTWLFHMLRCMLRDSEPVSRSGKARAHTQASSDEPFFRALRKIRDRYAGKRLSTEQMIAVFEEELPRPLWYENRHKLDWFLQGWINGTAIPELEARDVHFTEKATATVATGVIVQKDAPEDLVTAVPVYASTATNSLVFLGEVLADGRESTFHITVPASARKIVLDPHQTILTAPK